MYWFRNIESPNSRQRETYIMKRIIITKPFVVVFLLKVAKHSCPAAMGVDKLCRRRHMFGNDRGGQIFSGRKPSYMQHATAAATIFEAAAWNLI